ncbi:hypothetical protein BDF20DRAFT_817977 [Mycotypha africana]|uniref:uncharacterized protein n=1 Tax=Mycotypha africana TaxID=64632 RepID=UPI002300EE60|nr:uncharacterized protein BDF20DRAFT_817977 [Mycotypha africana]KAI8981875.1 hypothetical protein BDF20DRAFT_817977 [Mycotypha africana]
MATSTKKPTTTFKGMAILCFYPNGLLQGHCINTLSNESPFSLAGNKLIDYEDPKHNDCMEPNDFYKIVLRSNYKAKQGSDSIVSFILRREADNDASGLFTHEHEVHLNEGRQLKFTTQQFLSGQKALNVKNRYLKPSADSSHLFSNCHNDDLIVCMGDIELVM